MFHHGTEDLSDGSIDRFHIKPSFPDVISKRVTPGKGTSESSRIIQEPSRSTVSVDVSQRRNRKYPQRRMEQRGHWNTTTKKAIDYYCSRPHASFAAVVIHTILEDRGVRKQNETTMTTTDDGDVLTTKDELQVRGQRIQDLRLDLQRLRPEGLVGSVLLWWIWPVKFVADPAFAAAEALVPLVTSKVPLADKVVDLGLSATEAVAHALYGWTKRVGLVSSSSEDEFKTMSYYLALMELAPTEKERLLRKASESAGHLQFLLGVSVSSAASLLTHPDKVLTMLWEGYGALYKYAVK